MAKMPPKPEPLTAEEMRKRSEEFISQLQKESERGAALIGAAFLDDALRELLRSCFIQNKDAVDAAFSTEGFLGTFNSRTKLAYLLGHFGPKTYDAINVIREIRNRFAHYHQTVSFNDPDIKTLCLRLEPNLFSALYTAVHRKVIEDPRARFSGTVATIMVGLLVYQTHEKTLGMGLDMFVGELPEIKS